VDLSVETLSAGRPSDLASTGGDDAVSEVAAAAEGANADATVEVAEVAEEAAAYAAAMWDDAVVGEVCAEEPRELERVAARSGLSSDESMARWRRSMASSSRAER
jgi:hypothetical protein